MEVPQNKVVVPSFVKFRALTKLVWEVCNNNDDFILFINGPRGTGKSLAGITILREYLEKYFNISFTKKVLQEHVVYQHDLLFNRAKYLPDKHPILVDEGVRVAFTGDFATREVKELVKFFTQCRTKNRLVIFISPEFSDISKRLRNYAKYRVRMVERRKGVLFCRDDSEGVDPFHLNELKDIEKFHDMSVNVQQVISRLMKHPCYKDVLLFPVVPPDIQEWYGEYRDSAVYGEDQDSNFLGKNDRSFMVIYNLLKRWPLMLKEVRSELTQKYVRQFLCIDPSDGVPFWTTETPLANGLKLIKRRVEKPVLKEFKEVEVKENEDNKAAES